MSEASGHAGPALIWCPFPDVDIAATVANALIDEELIACANIIDGMTTLYVWNGEKDTGREAAALLKTNAAKLDRAMARLAALHPYDEPAILGWRCDAAAPGTVAWLETLGR